VLHLMSAAEGAEEFFSYTDESKKEEELEQAI
jgi:hypothetical protein